MYIDDTMAEQQQKNNNWGIYNIKYKNKYTSEIHNKIWILNKYIGKEEVNIIYRRIPNKTHRYSLL